MDRSTYSLPNFGTAPLSASVGLTPAELRAGLRAHAQAGAERSQLTLAESVTVQATLAYWASLTTVIPIRRPPRDAAALSASIASSAKQFGEALTALPVSEAGYQLGLL